MQPPPPTDDDVVQPMQPMQPMQPTDDVTKRKRPRREFRCMTFAEMEAAFAAEDLEEQERKQRRYLDFECKGFRVMTDAEMDKEDAEMDEVQDHYASVKQLMIPILKALSKGRLSSKP